MGIHGERDDEGERRDDLDAGLPRELSAAIAARAADLEGAAVPVLSGWLDAHGEPERGLARVHESALLRALLGLHPLVSGTLSWDGVELDRPLCSPQIAYVPQVPRLCSEPLTDAILLGLSPGSRLTEALSVAQLTQDLQVLPDGLETVVGPRGVRLSGGQLQRVALARALVRRPALLVVDDLSSALDVATESALWRDLSEVLADTSVLAVSHRPAVIARADVVITLDDGRVSSVDRRAEPVSV